VQRDSPIELVALTLDAEISESDGHTLITGTSTFKLHNTDILNDLQVPVGFPTWAGDPYAFDPARLDAFSVSVDGTKVKTLTPARAELKIGSVVRAVDWYTFTLSIAGDEKKTVYFDFQQDLGDGALPRFTYGLFPETTTLEQIVAYDPPNPDFDGQSFTWHFATKEPTANPTLMILRPALWDDLNAKRRAAQQNPNDANARAALGNLFRQLALMDSPRRDSFYGQAVAELETAVRLDLNNRAARQALATLYESRAGPTTGPRQPAYVLLAVAQWEALVSNDANARKQLAEDYFYLGLDAQTRLAFADAAAYYDKASALAPNGAGPLFLPDRAAAQRRALNIAWARALLEKGDAASAAPKARAALGDKFMASFNPPAFYLTHVQVTTAFQSRTMVFTIAPYAANLQTVNSVAESLNAAGADAALDNATNALTIVAPPDALEELARIVPDHAEWALVRAVLSPPDLAWDETDELFTHTTRYRESVDLSAACVAFAAPLDAISQSLKPLDNAPATDEEAQLKRTLLKYAQRGWQSALANGRVTYRVGADETRVEACTAQTVVASSSTWRPERVALIVAGIELVGIAVLVVRWRGKTRRHGDKGTRR
jgi:hypothetical protein